MTKVVNFHEAAVRYAPTRRLCRMFAQMMYEEGQEVISWNWLFLGELANDYQ